MLRVEEVIASVKVFDKREDLLNERDKIIRTKKAFSGLNVGYNHGYATNKFS